MYVVRKNEISQICDTSFLLFTDLGNNHSELDVKYPADEIKQSSNTTDVTKFKCH